MRALGARWALSSDHLPSSLLAERDYEGVCAVSFPISPSWELSTDFLGYLKSCGINLTDDIRMPFNQSAAPSSLPLSSSRTCRQV